MVKKDKVTEDRIAEFEVDVEKEQEKVLKETLATKCTCKDSRDIKCITHGG